MASLIAFPAHALLIVEERLREQEEQGVRMPAGVDRTELALRILLAAAEPTSATRASNLR